MARPLPNKFKPPQMEMFDDSTDPLDHLEAYKNHMNLQEAPDEIMCQAFPTTIKGSASLVQSVEAWEHLKFYRDESTICQLLHRQSKTPEVFHLFVEYQAKQRRVPLRLHVLPQQKDVEGGRC